MIPDFKQYCLNEASVKGIKKKIHGVLKRKDRERMRRLLRHNIVTFKFKKKNGDLRRAVGTLIPSYLPPLKGGSPKPEHQMVYYDMEKEHWRSFRSFSFIKIIDVESEEKRVEKEEIEKEKIEKRKKKEEKIKKHHIEKEKIKEKEIEPDEDEIEPDEDEIEDDEK